ncbi:hypothetical protein M0R72_15235 [Candidatus Pacearchaeota archaeon]|jgi:hypothetical protein|nr:hypothetical protein [Candidatus Pacearchaeota archaeon]
MKQVGGNWVFSEKENIIKNLLCQGKLQSEIAVELDVSRAYICQITKRFLKYNIVRETIPLGDIDKKEKHFKKHFITQCIENLGVNPKYIRPKTDISKKECPICKNLTPINPSTGKPRKYCSKDCHLSTIHGVKSKLLVGETSKRYCWKFNGSLKLRVRAFWNYKCFACNESEGKDVLRIHHILYNPSACCDGTKKALLIPLCLSCHNRTNHTKNREFWENLFLTQLMHRTNGTGKCYFSKKEWKEREWSKLENVNGAFMNGL